MKKVLGSMAGIIFAVFCVAILGLLMSFTLQALHKLFPDSFVNQMWGLVLFDIAAMVWALAFVFKSESVGQYAASGIGFFTGFIGTLLMVTFEVISSGQTFVTDNGSLGQWAVYGFIIVTAVHAALVYFYHASDPEIHAKINVGIAKGEIVTTAIKNATDELEREKSELSRSTHQKIVDGVKRDLGLPTIMVDPTVGFVPANTQPVTVPYPVEQKQTGPSLWDRMKNKMRKPAGTNTNEQTVIQQSKLQDKPKQDKDQELRAKLEDEYKNHIITPEAYQLLKAQLDMDAQEEPPAPDAPFQPE
jgi:hypothetical protein